MELLELKHLKKYYSTPHGKLHAVDDVNLTIHAGETVGIVGESGCGKSTLGKTVLRLEEPTSGEIWFDGEEISQISKRKFFELRPKMQMIFQDPYASLDPRMNVTALIREPLLLYKVEKDKEALQKRVEKLMDTVGIARRFANSYPHEMDGGRRQRVGIARAIALMPDFIMCDEPVSALDVSIQAQVLNLLMDLQEKFGLTYMFVTHDLSVVRHISDDISVMYLGQLVETCDSQGLFDRPLHPYTNALLSAIPSIDIDRPMQRVPLKGEITSAIDPKPGCRFAARCPHACERCLEQVALEELEPGHFVACCRARELNY